jgi:hypothetical protein
MDIATRINDIVIGFDMMRQDQLDEISESGTIRRNLDDLIYDWERRSKDRIVLENIASGISGSHVLDYGKHVINKARHFMTRLFTEESDVIYG